MDKLRAMEVFVRIVEEGSLTAAAAALGTSLTSVVRILSSLERALGVRLLNRTTRRIAVTEEGREYLERCRRVLSEVEEAESALTARQIRPVGRLACTAPVVLGRLHVAPLVAGFLSEYPGIRAELLLVDRVVDLLEEGLDVAVRIGHLPDSSLVAVAVGATHRVICASPDYLRRHGTPRRPADLARHRCIEFTGSARGVGWDLREGGKLVRTPIEPVLSINQVDGVLAACVQGLGCVRVLGYQVAELLAAGVLRRVLGECEPTPVPISVVYSHSRLLSSRVRAFVDWAVPRLRQRLNGVELQQPPPRE
ncbi:MAG TPA: LysR substrate-binding domain-containing protein [Anaeromyxobacteraceae bacterium]|nr:LysR substrate-binding domain-containing protein [Anaeromyxobacteraceae bacterium]